MPIRTRDHLVVNLNANASLVVDSRGPRHAMSVGVHTDRFVMVALGPTTARRVGMFIAHCVGNPSLHAYTEFGLDDDDDLTGGIELDVTDGEAEFTFVNPGGYTAGHVRIALDEAVALDLGVRLIAFAGPDLATE